MKESPLLLAVAILAFILTINVSTIFGSEDGSHQEKIRKTVVMSVWAKKAGGNLRPEYLQQQQIPSKQQNPTIASTSELGKDTATTTTESSESDEHNAILNPRKPPTLTPNINPTPSSFYVGLQTSGPSPPLSPDKSKMEDSLGDNKEGGQTVTKKESSEEQNSSYEDSEEECPETQFWHIRGQKCVPVHCPEVVSKRNPHTGECVFRYVGIGSRGRRRMYPYGNPRYNAKVRRNWRKTVFSISKKSKNLSKFRSFKGFINSISFTAMVRKIYEKSIQRRWPSRNASG
jgi:hypothetical protein